MADLNAHHTAFQHNRIDPLGQQLHALVTHKNLHHIGPFFPTFYAAHGKGTPDIVITNTPALQFQHYITPGPLSGSDHIPITLHLSNNPILLPATSPQYQYQHADWDAFKKTLSEQQYTLNLEHQPTRMIEETWTHLFNTITAIADTHIPKHRFKRKYSFTPSIRTRRLLRCYRTRFELNKLNLAPVYTD